jgi:hypothetical protein
MMFPVWIVPLAVVVPIALMLMEAYRFQQESERIALLIERLQTLAKKMDVPPFFARSLKSRRFSSDSYIEVRQIERVLTHLERRSGYRTPYRLRRLTLVSRDEVLGNLEKRLAKLEGLVVAEKGGSAMGS